MRSIASKAGPDEGFPGGCSAYFLPVPPRRRYNPTYLRIIPGHRFPRLPLRWNRRDSIARDGCLPTCEETTAMHDHPSPVSEAAPAPPKPVRSSRLHVLLRAFHTPARSGGPRRWHVPPRAVLFAFTPVLVGAVIWMTDIFGSELPT